VDDLDALPKPVQQPHPPLIVGGSGGPRSLKLAAQWADEYNTPFASPDECRELRGRLDDACEAAGRQRLPLSLMTGPEETFEATAERLAEYEAAGVERVMLQHLEFTDLETVERIGRELTTR
jgi:alkanesulfonate monooxygenase SsuD/methylene tetrahydromethanopterin reductase-like flavin-dependent oxidoreductase (luciferase family)